MKYISKIALTLILLISFSCTKDDSTISNVDSITDNVAIVSDNAKIIEASLNNTNPNLYVVEVKITNKKTKEVLPTFVHKFIPDNKNEFMNELPTKMNSFNGIFTIELEGQVLRKSYIKNGIVNNTEINDFVVTSTMKKYPCTAVGLITCADDEINGMNWIEYGFCLAGAPACLAEVYLSCGWENC